MVLSLILLFGCVSSENLYQEGVTEPLIVLSSASDILLIDDEFISVTVEYKFTRSRSDFEAYLDPRDGVKYMLTTMKFCGRHAYNPSYDCTTRLRGESGTIIENFRNKFDQGYAIGKGYVHFYISASYTDKKNVKHKGWVSNPLNIPAIFER